MALTPEAHGISLLPYMSLGNSLGSLSVRFVSWKLGIIIPTSKCYWEA